METFFFERTETSKKHIDILQTLLKACYIYFLDYIDCIDFLDQFSKIPSVHNMTGHRENSTHIS